MAENKNKQKNSRPPPPTPPMTTATTSQNGEQKTLLEEKEKEREDFISAMQLVNASVVPMALKTAIDLGVLDILAEAGPDSGLTAEEILDRIPTRNPEAPKMLERLLRVLIMHQVLGCKSDGYENDCKKTYYLTCVSKYFARDEDGVSLAPLLALSHDKVFLDSWSGLKDAILEGGNPFNRAHGLPLFEYTARDARFSQIYNTAMNNRTTLVVRKLLNSYNGFKNLTRVVDVGGGIGVALSLITSKYPSVKGINFDLPHVVQHAPPFPGVKQVGGDMFRSLPKGDAIILMWMLHDWDDEHCLKLLKNCLNALPDDGKVIVVEQILPTFADTASSFQDKIKIDGLSLAQSPGGKERMEHEIRDLALTAGFKSVCIASFVFNYIVMEFLKQE